MERILLLYYLIQDFYIFQILSNRHHQILYLHDAFCKSPICRILSFHLRYMFRQHILMLVLFFAYRIDLLLNHFFLFNIVVIYYSYDQKVAAAFSFFKYVKMSYMEKIKATAYQPNSHISNSLLRGNLPLKLLTNLSRIRSKLSPFQGQSFIHKILAFKMRYIISL